MKLFFFFSSRRRHTRWNCDWSSDVCSSDLASAVDVALRDLRSRHPEIPIVLGGAAVGGGLPTAREGMKVLERIDESLDAVLVEVGARAVCPLAAQASVVASVKEPVRDCLVSVVGALNVGVSAGDV